MQHLLNDENDPFNRMPLRADQLEPMTELKQRIEIWCAPAYYRCD
jgi:ubiquitin conjugation factor E4 B